MCVCLFSRVINHSIVLKQRNVLEKKEVVLSGGGIFLFFSLFFSLDCSPTTQTRSSFLFG